MQYSPADGQKTFKTLVWKINNTGALLSQLSDVGLLVPPELIKANIFWSDAQTVVVSAPIKL